MTTQLTVSTKELSCNMILKQLKKMKLDANVLEGKSLVENNIETSCQITFAKKFGEEDMKPLLKDTWHQLKKEHHFTCAHLKIDGKYSGCVLDYLQPSVCTGPWDAPLNNKHTYWCGL